VVLNLGKFVYDTVSGNVTIAASNSIIRNPKSNIGRSGGRYGNNHLGARYRRALRIIVINPSMSMSRFINYLRIMQPY
jgi:hypothetical protein